MGRIGGVGPERHVYDAFGGPPPSVGSRQFCASTPVNTVRTFTRPYDGEIDLFLVYCPDRRERVYAVDIDEAASSQGVLRVEPTANGQAKGIRWAADHELPA